MNDAPTDYYHNEYNECLRDAAKRQPQPDPLIAAMGKMLVASLNREVGLEATIIDLQRRVAELEVSSS